MTSRRPSPGPLAFAALAVLTAAAAAAWAPVGQAHDFDETRRFVLSIEEDHVDVFVAYEVRPGRAADALVAHYDSDHDGLATTALERLARAQTIGPRLRHGVGLETEAGELAWSLSRLEFPAPPDDAGRRGVAAAALYTAPLGQRPTAAAPLSLTFRTRGARGQVSVEAQATALYELRAEALSRRPGDPVLGPLAVGPWRALALSVRPVTGR